MDAAWLTRVKQIYHLAAKWQLSMTMVKIYQVKHYDTCGRSTPFQTDQPEFSMEYKYDTELSILSSRVTRADFNQICIPVA